MKAARIIAWSWITFSSLFMLVATGAELVSDRTATICLLIQMPLTIVWGIGAYTTALYTEKPAWMTTEDSQPNIIQMPWTYERTSSAPEPPSKPPVVVRQCMRCDNLYIVRDDNCHCPKCVESLTASVEKQEKLRRFIDLRGE